MVDVGLQPVGSPRTTNGPSHLQICAGVGEFGGCWLFRTFGMSERCLVDYVLQGS